VDLSLVLDSIFLTLFSKPKKPAGMGCRRLDFLLTPLLVIRPLVLDDLRRGSAETWQPVRGSLEVQFRRASRAVKGSTPGFHATFQHTDESCMAVWRTRPSPDCWGEHWMPHAGNPVRLMFHVNMSPERRS